MHQQADKLHVKQQSSLSALVEGGGGGGYTCQDNLNHFALELLIVFATIVSIAYLSKQQTMQVCHAKHKTYQDGVFNLIMLPCFFVLYPVKTC